MTPPLIQTGPLTAAFDRCCARLEQIGFAEALAAHRADIWSADTGVQEKVAQRLGWVDALAFVTPHLDRLRSFAASIRDAGFTDVVLLGMGGSSLAPEVLRQVIGVADGYPRFRMLDSVDPEAVAAAMGHAATSLFVLASKSGSTIEPNVMAAEAQARVVAAGHAEWGQRFVAITDPDTELHTRARAQNFRDIFVNPPDIGGRYSALSLFGMVPAALMGADLDRLLESAREMDSAWRSTPVRENPALALGALMAAGAEEGRDKLTLLLPDRLRSLGLWIEQLVGESTGKHGKGVVPIAGEPAAARLGADRCLVAIDLGGDTVPVPSEALLPLMHMRMADPLAIGAEFLRWEVATAAAGLLMRINPFDEPNVQQAKDATRALLSQYTSRRQLPTPPVHGSSGGVRVSVSRAAEEALNGEPATSFLRTVGKGDYVGLMAYLPPDDPAWREVLDALRNGIGEKTGAATMFGYGPRYLHSTGQLHKGGANNGVFVIVMADGGDLAIPGQDFSFAVLEQAQAIGDFQSLDGTGRRALLVHLPRRDPALLRQLTGVLLGPS